MIKVREFKESNYRGVWFNGKTIRVALDPKREITELEYPEFYDIKCTGYCKGGCVGCYMDSKPKDKHYVDIVSKVYDYFGKMTPNQRPFQVAIGGGEPTSHPDFIELLKAFYYLDIQPNYTSNGMHLTGYILQATVDYCGGVALSCHDHLERYWKSATTRYIDAGVKLNFHIVISSVETVDYFMKIYEEYHDVIDYFVLLPYSSQGRGSEKVVEWEYLVSQLPDDTRQIAFGANFYPKLVKGDHNIKVSLYEPEIMSKFLDLKDMKLYKSSFDVGV